MPCNSNKLLQDFWIQRVFNTLLYHCSPGLLPTMSILVLGYGQTGPLSQRAGYDAVASAVSGLMHITGPEVGVIL